MGSQWCPVIVCVGKKLLAVFVFGWISVGRCRGGNLFFLGQLFVPLFVARKKYVHERFSLPTCETDSSCLDFCMFYGGADLVLDAKGKPD